MDVVDGRWGVGACEGGSGGEGGGGEEGEEGEGGGGRERERERERGVSGHHHRYGEMVPEGEEM